MGETPPADRELFAWHVHHDVLMEVLLEPFEYRRLYIKVNKPAKERDLRLRLLKPVEGALPTEVVEVAREYLEAKERREKAWSDYFKELLRLGPDFEDANYSTAKDNVLALSVRLKRALYKHRDAIESLHRVECPDCPWDGHTILPKAEGGD
jgi:hypothetical protein